MQFFRAITKRYPLKKNLRACHAIRQRRFVCPWRNRLDAATAARQALFHHPKFSEVRDLPLNSPSTTVSRLLGANGPVEIALAHRENLATGTRTGVAGSRGKSAMIFISGKVHFIDSG